MSEPSVPLRMDLPPGLELMNSGALAFGDEPPGVFLSQADAVMAASLVGDVLEGADEGRSIHAHEQWLLRQLHRRLIACVADPYLRERLGVKDAPASHAGGQDFSAKMARKVADVRRSFFLRLTLPWKRRG